MNSGSYGEVDGVAAGTSTITVRYSDYVYTYNGVTCNGSLSPHQVYAIAFVEPTLTCGSVTRGQTVTCSPSSIPPGATFSNWKFTDGTNSVTSSSTSSSWSGIAVRTGTVSVTITLSGMTPTLSASLTVNARTGWAFSASSSNQVPPQTLVCQGSTVVLTSPPSSSSREGYSCLQQGSSYNYQTISGGPNSGYTYITSASNTTTYQWEIVPDLANTSSQFYQAQCGQNGFILNSNLAVQTQRHEAGLARSNYVQSHWIEYKSAQDNLSNNIGNVYEGLVAAPGVSIANVVNASAISTKQSSISSAEQAEPYPINDDEYGNFLGNINVQPYQKCP